MYSDYVNGYVERRKNAKYEGSLTIDGVFLEGGIEATYFQQSQKTYLWLRRRRVLEYDEKSGTYRERQRKPFFECYLEKQLQENIVAYKGVFTFLRFKYSIVGVWDKILGTEKQNRLNLYVERLPMTQQTILNGINEMKRNAKK